MSMSVTGEAKREKIVNIVMSELGRAVERYQEAAALVVERMNAVVMPGAPSGEEKSSNRSVYPDLFDAIRSETDKINAASSLIEDTLNRCEL